MEITNVLSKIKRDIIFDDHSYKVNFNKDCSDVTSMYQDIQDSSIFILKSSKHSKKYAIEAVKKNPVLIITNMPLNSLDDIKGNVYVMYIDNYDSVAIKLVHLFYDKYIEQLKFIAVTGTNGKTTTSHMICKLLSKMDVKVATIGTLGVYDDDYNKIEFLHSTPTTPMHFEFAEIIKYFAERDYDYIVYEATSIALDQRRVDFIENEIAVFTNFSSEHLEYHHTIENYLESKLKLDQLSKRSMVNYDTKEYLKICNDKYHFSNNNDTYYKYELKNNKLYISIGKEVYKLDVLFNGTHNYINLATSIFTLHKLNFNIIDILKAVETMKPPAHRFETFEINDYQFILDFAHTPLAIKESIEDALRYASNIDKQLTVMITGVGLRGYDKIESTMKLIPKYIDQVVLASEQVGYENENLIIDTMIKNLPKTYDLNNLIIGKSRKEAIEKIINKVNKKENIILLTGINEPQHYRGKLIGHDDKTYITKCINHERG